MTILKSLQGKIIALTTIPVLLVALILAVEAYLEVNHLGEEELKQIEEPELAKRFGTDESSAFVNGVLDRLAKAFDKKDFDQKRGQ